MNSPELGEDAEREPAGRVCLRFESKDGTVLSVDTYPASGPQVLVIPGSLSSARDWYPVAIRTRSCSIAVLDRRDHGRSGPGCSSYTLAREIEDVGEAARRTQPDVLLGHSFGGLLALHAILGDVCPSALFLLEPALLCQAIDSSALKRVRQLISEGALDRALALGLVEFVGLDDVAVSGMPRHTRWSRMRELVHTWPREIDAINLYASRQDVFSTLAVPTVVAIGEASTVRFTTAARATSRALPAAHLQAIPRFSHAGFHTHPREMARVVDEHVASLRLSERNHQTHTIGKPQ